MDDVDRIMRGSGWVPMSDGDEPPHSWVPSFALRDDEPTDDAHLVPVDCVVWLLDEGWRPNEHGTHWKRDGAKRMTRGLITLWRAKMQKWRWCKVRVWLNHYGQTFSGWITTRLTDPDDAMIDVMFMLGNKGPDWKLLMTDMPKGKVVTLVTVRDIAAVELIEEFISKDEETE